MTSVSGVTPVTIAPEVTRPDDADGSVSGAHRTYSPGRWPSKRTNAWAWALLVLIILGGAAIRLRLLDAPLDRDEGEYAYFGQLLLQGIPPYAQASNLKMPGIYAVYALRSEEHTSELQSRLHLVCRLLLEKKKKIMNKRTQNKSTGASANA